MQVQPFVFSTRHLGLALFSLSLLAFASLSISQFAPSVRGLPTMNGKVAKKPETARRTRLRVQLVLTFVCGAAAIWMVALGGHGQDDDNWAYGTLLMLLGYWINF